MQKLRKGPKELINIYPKDQLEYIQCEINKIRTLVEDKQS